jgi:hypothetical protein
MIFLHVGFTVGVVFRKMASAYYPTMVATNAADNKCEAIDAIDTV